MTVLLALMAFLCFVGSFETRMFSISDIKHHTWENYQKKPLAPQEFDWRLLHAHLTSAALTRLFLAYAHPYPFAETVPL